MAEDSEERLGDTGEARYRLGKRQRKEVKKDSFSAEELDSWGWLAQARKERKRSKIIENEKIDEQNQEKMVKKYLEFEGIASQEMLKNWTERKGLNEKDLLKLAIRHKKWLSFCSKRFKSMAATLFLKRKAKLDRVSFQLVWTKDEAFCNELFVRIKEKECTIEEAKEMTEEAPKGLGKNTTTPVALGDLAPALAEVLRVSQPGQLWPPRKAEHGWILIQHKKTLPAVFNKSQKEALILELGEKWLNEEIKNAENA